VQKSQSRRAGLVRSIGARLPACGCCEAEATPLYDETEEGVESFRAASSGAASRVSVVAAPRRVLHVGAFTVSPSVIGVASALASILPTPSRMVGVLRTFRHQLLSVPPTGRGASVDGVRGGNER
jgi:hypothetical protein